MAKCYKIIWSKTAENDLERILNYIAEKSVFKAQKVLSRIKKRGNVKFFV